MKKNRTLLITGASSGLGRALALAYADCDVTLFLTGRDPERLAETSHRARARGACVDEALADVTDRAALTRQILAWDDRSPIDLVLANAGISGGGADAYDADVFARIVDTNLHGVLNTVLPLAPRLAARGEGHIALISSMASFRGLPSAPAYSVSKVAVRALGDALRPLLAAQNVAVSVVCPGFIRTPLTDVNAFPMPFLMNAEDAAQTIRRGLDARRTFIVFPKRLDWACRLLCVLPCAWTDAILARSPKKF